MSTAARLPRPWISTDRLTAAGLVLGLASAAVVHTAWLLLPFWAGEIVLGWAAVVAIRATQRLVAGYRALG